MDHTICYISKHAPALNDKVQEDLFSFILEHNPPKNITGILLSNQDFFLQVLEGNENILEELFNSIKKDNRHFQILTVLNQPIENRVFKDYRAGFSILQNRNEFSQLNNYLSLYDHDQNYPKNIKSLLEPFLI
ncbi:BLUF domain-containing protein [Aequorivita sp. H23M31]|uniref:BLUF domain-containing protein n=1 Tax=Aequorivita ciconiae TaxID=2494375 RepID=A0A410G6F4_9FLAO|nr:BLUF domain-containing protein [Aequorivita sp. H23M31]QAA82842.1 BLUF domain-containing protein [Aequorivita sp. H23M31]